MRPGSARVHHELVGLHICHIGVDLIETGREYLHCRIIEMFELLMCPSDVLRIL